MRAGYCIFLLLSYIDLVTEGVKLFLFLPFPLAIYGSSPTVNQSRSTSRVCSAAACAHSPVKEGQKGTGCWARSFGSSCLWEQGEHWGHSSRNLLQPGLVSFSAGPFHYSTSTVVFKIVLEMKIGHWNNCNNNSIYRAGNMAKLLIKLCVCSSKGLVVELVWIQGFSTFFSSVHSSRNPLLILSGLHVSL